MGQVHDFVKGPLCFILPDRLISMKRKWPVAFLLVSIVAAGCHEKEVEEDGETEEAAAVCGNLILEEGEACEAGILGDTTCEELGHVGGTLGCTTDCRFDESACHDCPAGDPCAEVTCSGHGSCLRSVCEASCDCDDGYVAAGTACVSDGVPRQLICLIRWYGGLPVETADGWVLRFPDGEEIVFDDGLTKTFDEKLNAPDLEDMLTLAYPTGAIEPVNTLDLDPGRFRNELLFKEAYGASMGEVNVQLVLVPWGDQVGTFHRKIQTVMIEVSEAVSRALDEDPSLAEYTYLGLTWQWKYILHTTRLSMHSFGIALDLDSDDSYYWEDDVAAGNPIEWNNQMPQVIVDVFESHGFIWGGRWYHYDTMHFEYRPELFDPDCAP